jgi:hypothetical protein
MRKQRVEQRAVRNAGTRMHDEARRLVDHDHVAILEHDLERHALRAGRRAAAQAAEQSRSSRRP